MGTKQHRHHRRHGEVFKRVVHPGNAREFRSRQLRTLAYVGLGALAVAAAVVVMMALQR